VPKAIALAGNTSFVIAESCSVTDTYLLRALAYQRCVPMQLKCRRRSVVITDIVLHFTQQASTSIVLQAGLHAVSAYHYAVPVTHTCACFMCLYMLVY
jgi:hypothetical protein